MEDAAKAYLKISYGYLKGANALATALGYGALTFVTGNHRRTHHALDMARWGLQSAKDTINEGKAELAEATSRK